MCFHHFSPLLQTLSGNMHYVSPCIVYKYSSTYVTTRCQDMLVGIIAGFSLKSDMTTTHL